MRIAIIFLVFMGGYANAQPSEPLSSYLSYEMNRIDKDAGEFILKNVFAPQLFENLKQNFPDQKNDWTAWVTGVKEYTSEDGKDKTKLKGCFDISKIHDDSKLVSSIMRISMARFQAAIKFYSTPSSNRIPQEKVDQCLMDMRSCWKIRRLKKQSSNWNITNKDRSREAAILSSC